VLPVKAVAVAVVAALVAKAVAAVKHAPKALLVAHAMALLPHVAADLHKARAVIVKIGPKEVLRARLQTVSKIAMIATTTDAMTVAPAATNCHVTLIPS
jgi:hypothetical protein